MGIITCCLGMNPVSVCVCVGVYMKKVARRGENCRVEFHSGIQMIPAEFSWTCLVHTLAYTQLCAGQNIVISLMHVCSLLYKTI